MTLPAAGANPERASTEMTAKGQSDKGLETSAVPLASLKRGEWCELNGSGLAKSSLEPSEAELLRALGLTPHSRMRVCQPGEPCIVQVGGTRIGIHAALAAKISVRRSGAKGARIEQLDHMQLDHTQLDHIDMNRRTSSDGRSAV